jgi:cytochrome c oxidase subunit 2
MRESTAKGAALGTGAMIVAAVALFAALQQVDREVAAPVAEAETAPIAPQDQPQVPDTILALGARVYDEQGCAGCHSIAGVGSPRSPLDGVGTRLTAERIRLWIVDPQAARPGVRKPSYDDLPVAELEALVAYLRSLR